MATIPVGQSRLVCWLDADLNLPGSALDAAGHTVFGFNNTNGASVSWKAGRQLNSLPNNRITLLGTYRIQAGTAQVTLPNKVAGTSTTADLSGLAGLPKAVLNVSALSGTTATTFSFDFVGSTPGDSGTNVQGYDLDFGDGSPLSFSNIATKQYTSAGTYIVRARVMNNNNIRGLWVTKTIVVTAVGSPVPTPGTFQSGMNMSPISDWFPSPFIDRFKSARAPIPSQNGGFGTGTLDLDSLGFVRGFVTPNTTWQAPIILEDGRLNCPSGTWIFKWTGDRNKATITLRNGTLTYVSSTPTVRNGVNTNINKYTFQWNGQQDVWIDGSNYASDIGNQYPTDFQLIPPGNDINGVPYENSTELFNTPFLKRCRWRHLRFMDWIGSNWNSPTSGNQSVAWEERTTPAHYSQSRNTGASLEYAASLCNKVGANGWFNIPAKYSNDAITKMLTYLRDNLNPNLSLVVEYSNESWNTAGNFLQGQYMAAKAKEIGIVPQDMPGYEAQWKYAAYQTVNIAKIADTVFNGTGASARSRINVTHNCQVAFGGADQARQSLNFIHPTYGIRCGEMVDSLALAPYFGWNRNYANSVNMTIQEMFDHIKNVIIDQENTQQINNHRIYANELGNKLLINYEGGSHLDDTPGQNQTEQEFFRTRFNAMIKDERMYSLFIYYYGKMVEGFGSNVALCHFSDCQRHGRGLAAPNETPGSYWGISEFLTQSLNDAPRRKAFHFLNGDDLSQITEVSW